MIISFGESGANFPGGRMAGDQIPFPAEDCFAFTYLVCYKKLAGSMAQSKPLTPVKASVLKAELH